MTNDTNNEILAGFSDPEVVANYAAGRRTFVPGFDAVHRTSHDGDSARRTRAARREGAMLGAGGGLEMRALAQTQPQWTFVGVDPSRQMLDLAVTTLGWHRARNWSKAIRRRARQFSPGRGRARQVGFRATRRSRSHRARRLRTRRRRAKPLPRTCQCSRPIRTKRCCAKRAFRSRESFLCGVHVAGLGRLRVILSASPERG